MQELGHPPEGSVWDRVVHDSGKVPGRAVKVTIAIYELCGGGGSYLNPPPRQANMRTLVSQGSAHRVRTGGKQEPVLPYTTRWCHWYRWVSWNELLRLQGPTHTAGHHVLCFPPRQITRPPPLPIIGLGSVCLSSSGWTGNQHELAGSVGLNHISGGRVAELQLAPRSPSPCAPRPGILTAGCGVPGLRLVLALRKVQRRVHRQGGEV